MASFNGAEVQVYAPGKTDEKRDIEAVEKALYDDENVDIPIAKAEGKKEGHIERLVIRDGKLSVGAWTGEEHGRGWYVDVEIPLLPTSSLQLFLSDLASTLGNFSDRFKVEQLEKKHVGNDGRVSVGTKYAGEERRVAVLED